MAVNANRFPLLHSTRCRGPQRSAADRRHDVVPKFTASSGRRLKEHSQNNLAICQSRNGSAGASPSRIKGRDGSAGALPSRITCSSCFRNFTKFLAPFLIIVGVFHSAGQADENGGVILVRSMTTVLIQQAEIPARDSGILTLNPVKPGDRVKEGQVLGQLDEERQLLSVKAAELNLQIAQWNADSTLPLDVARAHVREAELQKSRLEIAAMISTQLAESDVGVRLAQKTRESSQFELERARKAREDFKGSISNAELNRLQVLFDQRTLEIEKAEEDQAIAKLKPAAEKAAVAEQAETVQRARLTVLEKEHEQRILGTSLDVAGNELDVAKLQLDRRRLLAPFDAILVTVNRQPGEWVEPGTSVFRVIQTDRLRVEGFVTADEANSLKRGMVASILFPDSSLHPANGEITFISQEIDSINQQVRIWADFDNSEGLIRPGLVANMEIDVTQPNPAASKNASPFPTPRNSK